MKEKIKSGEFIRIEQSIEEFISMNNFKLVDIDVLKDGKETHVVLFVFNEQSDIDSISKLNEKIYEILENVDFLKGGFSLEISSPGISRKIKFIEEFDIFKGKNVRVLMEDGNVLTGISCGISNDNVVVKINDEEILLDKNLIKKAALNG